MDDCRTCRKEVEQEERALMCDFCKGWEHVSCVRECDTPSEALYDALVSCRSKAIVYGCTSCQKKSSTAKRVHELELQGERDRSTYERSLREMQAERDQLQANVEELERHLLEAKRRISEVQTLAREQRLAAESCLIGTLRSETHESAAHMDAVQATEGSNPHPPGFKLLSQRVEKFSGRSGENDFEVWMLDFIEATEDCGWSDEQRARWFSWFLSGPTKAT